MAASQQFETEAPVTDEIIDREELARLAHWHWEMRGSPQGTPDEDWFWAEEELRRQRQAAIEELQRS